MAVFVLGRDKQPLMPCTERRARLLLSRNRACVHRMMPFTIRLKDRTQADCVLQSLRLKLDPGSRYTGIAVVRERGFSQFVVFLAELQHRGLQIRDALESRSQLRRSRRNRKTRYRPARFNNRTKPKGWLAPSLLSRVDNCMSWVDRLRKWLPITKIDMELVKFDAQKLMRPEISGIQYQQGELAGCEVREYLLEKFSRVCVYCGAKGVPLEIEHIHPKSKGGSNRISNLALACRPCNQKKGSQDVKDFLKSKPTVLKKVLAQAKKPLKDAAAVNATRWKLFNSLKATGLPVDTVSGARAKFNRSRLNIPKTHALDAACAGKRIRDLHDWQQPTLTIKAMGRGRYKRTLTDKYGFPRSFFMEEKSIHGFQTGDLVKAVVPKGKNQGTHIGRVAVRKTGSFDIKTLSEKLGVSWKHCSLLQRADGYSYLKQQTK